MHKNKKSFIGYIKGLFTPESGCLPTLEVSTPIPDVKPCKKVGVSDPIYLLVEKLLENPKLLKITKLHDSYRGEHDLFIPILNLEGRLINNCDHVDVMIGGLDITEDESDYMVNKLYDVYDTRNERIHEILYKRALRCMKRSEKAKRIELQNKLENM